MGGHADMILLVGGGRRAVGGAGVGEVLVLAHEGCGRDLGDHQTGVQAGFGCQEGRQVEGQGRIDHQLEGGDLAVGHAGDGNLHVAMPYADDETRRRALVINDSIVYKAIELDGTSTGEHGVGIGKMKFMSREHGVALDVMRTIKQALDPHGILNPGKIFSAESS